MEGNSEAKYEGGWDLKNIKFFRKSLATKILWRVITHEILYKHIKVQKCINPRSIIDIIKN